MGTVGRLVPAKNHRLFLEVAAAVAGTHPEAAFLLVGGGVLLAALRAEVARLGLQGRVVVTGERDDVGDLLGAMNVFLLTSEREGMPNAAMEAMAAGLPCVVTDAGGAGELVVDGETGYVCPRGNRTELVAAVERLCGDPGLRWTLGDNGRARIHREFTAERMAATTAALYRSLLLRRGTGPAVTPTAAPPDRRPELTEVA